MGTLCEIRAFGKEKPKINQAVTLAFEEIAKLEGVLSNYRQDSEIMRISRIAALSPQVCSGDLMAVLKLSQHYARLTQGAFDVTVGPLIQLWGIQSEGRIPTEGEIADTLSRIGYSRLVLDETLKTVRFIGNGMALDFGGIGKGYALDRAAEILKAHGIKAVILNLGGNILVVGSPPFQKAWTIEVSDPKNPQGILAQLKVSNASISTSSQIERSKNIKGRRIGHIFDPRSGKPVEFEGSVTVIAPTATEADALSTALLVMGPENGLTFMENRKEGAAFFLVPSRNGDWEARMSSRCAFYGMKRKFFRKEKI